jgi:signal transduction histidine kinase
MSGQRSRFAEIAPPASRDAVERFLGLAQELLRTTTRGVLRRDLLPRLAQRIQRFSGADTVELWVKEGASKHFRCCVTGSEKTLFGFTLVPHALGERTGLPTGGPRDDGLETLCRRVINGTVDRSRDGFTERGSFWTGDARRPVKLGHEGRSGAAPDELLLPGSFRSLVLIPIALEGECIGLLGLRSRKGDFCPRRDVLVYEDISDILGITLSHQYAEIELRERIKELTCLYGIAQVVGQPEAPFDDVMQGIVNLLPPAWLHPEIACARICLDGRCWVTEGFRSTPHRQVAEIIVKGGKVGFVELVYLESRLTLDEGPFLAEERSLIDNVAREVAVFYERSRAEAEKASLQDQLRHADRLATIGQLAAGVAHELNEPLANILGFAQLAKKTADLPAQVSQDLTSIESASLHAREIIKKLMTFARELPPKKTLARLNAVVEEGLYFFEARCLKAGIELKRRLDPDLPAITIDAGQINQVLVNLVVNAIQAMPDGGTLTVETRKGERSVRLAVEDTGIGMSDELRQQIFMPFFTTKDIHEGTGLGLAVVHGIVTSHGGSITVRSRVGKGSRFVIRLPLRAPDAA